MRQLKKQLQRELKHQQATTNKSSYRSRWLVLVIFIVLATGSYWLFLENSKSASQRLFIDAVKSESHGEITTAVAGYQRIYQLYPQSAQAPQALFRLGKLQQYDLHEEQLALLSYLQLEHDYPSNELVLSANEESAKIVKYGQRDYPRAIELYQRLLDFDSETSDQYYFEIADCYFRIEKFSQARIELEMLLEKYPASSLAADALYRKGVILILEGQNEAARHDFRQLIKDYPASQYRQAAELDLAKLLEEEEFLKEALLLYQQLKASNQTLMVEEKIKYLQRRIAEKKEAI